MNKDAAYLRYKLAIYCKLHRRISDRLSRLEKKIKATQGLIEAVENSHE